MSLGSEIFLSSVVIAVVMLYGLTKDRWRWGPFVKRAIFTFLAIVAIAGTIAGALYIWNQLPLALARQTEYAGLRLGISQDEVIYIKGVPQTVNGELETEGPLKGSRPTIEKGKLEKGKQVRDYDDWAYNGDYSRINVTFNMKKTAVTAYSAIRAISYLVARQSWEFETAIARKRLSIGSACPRFPGSKGSRSPA
jgi:hypothetical protein